MDIYDKLLIILRSYNIMDTLLLVSVVANEIFYISVVAIGFWLSPGRKSFVQLGILISFTTILNLFLKHIFVLIGLESGSYLLPVDYMFSFPSGHTMVATTFWVFIVLKWRSMYTITSAIFVILMVLIARMYADVHSIENVIGGMLFGFAILALWQTKFVQILYRKWVYTRHISYWIILLIMLIVYFLMVEGTMYSNQFMVSMGSLIGIGLSFNTISKWHYIDGMFHKNHIISIMISYIAFVIIYAVIPVFNISSNMYFISMVLKYVILSFIIFDILPRFQIAIVQTDRKNILH